jgi:hypothetical protein
MITRENITYTIVQVPNTLTKFKAWEFSSGPVIDEDFRVFARLFKKHVTQNLPTEAVLVKFNSGHYYVSGFIERQGKYAYFSISDVRHFPNDWHNNILVRTAKSETDYSGGCNRYTTLDNFTRAIDNLLSA